VIRVRKPDLVPEILRDRGAALTEELCTRADAGEQLHFDRDVYGAAEVKEALRAAQHDKCCFCEAKLGHAQFGDVEHFRPKATAQQGPGDAPVMGYYWLAYEWKNLYLSCAVCNQRHKRCLFPLADPNRRVSSHRRAADLDTEQPLFVDPGSEDPTVFIEYRREYLAPLAGSARGSATVAALQLNRQPLVERRRERRELLRACLIVVAKAIASTPSDDDDRETTRVLNIIADATTDRGEYSSMARALLRQVAPWRKDWAIPASSLLEALRADAARGLVLRV
jgi:uncharacterized protein (TIGR02646 family)